MAPWTSFQRDTSGGTLQDGLWIKKRTALYPPLQVVTWLSAIGFQEPFTELDIAQGRFPTTLDNLHRLIRLQLVSYPYENTMMHYSADHAMDISTDGLYQRMVIGRRGSYCFGLNTLLFQMLRGLGYRAYTGSARINISKEPTNPVYTAPLHMVIFVQPGDESSITYLVDVGCGGSGPTRPILLSNAEDNVIMGASPTEQHRLSRGSRPESTLAISMTDPTDGSLEWRLEVLQEKEDAPHPVWRVVYSFSEEEHLPTDFESANIAVYQNPGLIFWKDVICSKNFWVDSEEIGAPDAEIDASILRRYMGRIGMEGGVIRRHIGSRSETIRTVTTEVERVDALLEIFGLAVAPGDIEHIRGRASALEGKVN